MKTLLSVPRGGLRPRVRPLLCRAERRHLCVLGREWTVRGCQAPRPASVKVHTRGRHGPAACHPLSLCHLARGGSDLCSAAALNAVPRLSLGPESTVRTVAQQNTNAPDPALTGLHSGQTPRAYTPPVTEVAAPSYTGMVWACTRTGGLSGSTLTGPLWARWARGGTGALRALESWLR